MSSRIYRVDAVRGPNAECISYLVVAVSHGKAQQHIAKKYINAKVASPNDVAQLMGVGIKIEHSVPQEPEAAPPLSAPPQADGSVPA